MGIAHYDRLHSQFEDDPSIGSTEYASLVQSQLIAAEACVSDGTWPQSAWAEDITPAYIQAVSNSQCVVDVGSGAGFYTFLALQHMPGGRVVAIEADPIKATALQAHFESSSRVTVLNRAASDSAGMQAMVKPPGGSCTCAEVRGHGFEVRSEPLDDLLEGLIVDVIKMDIEGAEVLAIQGMTRILAEDQPVFFLESHPWVDEIVSDGLMIIKTLLQQCGYGECHAGETRPLTRLHGRMQLRCMAPT